MYDITITRLTPAKQQGSTLAFGKVQIGPVGSSFRLVEGGSDRKPFAAFPSKKGKDGNWYPEVTVDKSVATKVAELAIAALEAQKSE